MRGLISLVLAVLLAVTSVTLASVRGAQAAPGSTIVLCVGGGLVSVRLGPDGTPEGPPMICPDGLVNGAVPLTDLAPLPGPGLRLGALPPLPQRSAIALTPVAAAPARAPPFLLLPVQAL